MAAGKRSGKKSEIERYIEEHDFSEEEFFTTKNAKGSQQRLSLAAYSVIHSNKNCEESKLSVSEFISNAIIEYGIRILPANVLHKHILGKHNPVNNKRNFDISLDGIKTLILFLLTKTILSSEKNYSTFCKMIDEYEKKSKRLSKLPLDRQIEELIKQSNIDFKEDIFKISLWYAVMFSQQLGIVLPAPKKKEEADQKGQPPA